MDGDNRAYYRRWTDCEWWEDEFEHLWSGSCVGVEDGERKGGVRVLNDLEGRECLRCRKEDVVYLTADADDMLEELKEGEIYVLGGIVDHNRYKVRGFT